jgi:hypothetical protein
MASWEQKARHFAATKPALEREQFERALALGLEAMRRPIVFRWIGEAAGADVFEIGREGEPTRGENRRAGRLVGVASDRQR